MAAGAMKAVIVENGVGRGLPCRLGLQRAVHATAWYAAFIVSSCWMVHFLALPDVSIYCLSHLCYWYNVGARTSFCKDSAVAL